MARHDRVAIDLGTGDGRAVLARASAEPRTLVIGLDANAAAMAEASRRASRPLRAGGLPNALFAVAAAEDLPAELRGLAATVQIVLPWGSLLDAVIGQRPATLAEIADLAMPRGVVRAIVSIAPRDPIARAAVLDDDDPAGPISRAWSAAGLEMDALRAATSRELRALPSTWARKLRLGTTQDDRATWVVEGVRRSPTTR